MFTLTDKDFLKEYMCSSDQEEHINKFRMYYQGKQTNLIWYDGRIFYIPQECFELKNLVNVDINKKYKSILYANELHILKDIHDKKINFLLEENLKELYKRFQASGLPISIIGDLGIEILEDTNYTALIEPIYLGSGAWLNFEV